MAGGMGSHACAWLFRRIVSLCPVGKDQEYPEILVHNNSRIPDRTQAITGMGKSPLPELLRTIHIFNDADVDVALLACMTAHYYYDRLQEEFNGVLLDATEIVKQELLGNEEFRHKRRVGLIGSTGLIRSGIFQRKLEPAGYEVITLNDEDQEAYFMRPIYMEGGIKAGVIEGKPRTIFARQLNILADMGCEVIIGACSELPLVIQGPAGIPLVDAFDLLARNAVKHCYNM
jgi:aspartate racemase